MVLQNGRSTCKLGFRIGRRMGTEFGIPRFFKSNSTVQKEFLDSITYQCDLVYFECQISIWNDSHAEWSRSIPKRNRR